VRFGGADGGRRRGSFRHGRKRLLLATPDALMRAVVVAEAGTRWRPRSPVIDGANDSGFPPSRE
jgi:hypothetical protein